MASILFVRCMALIYLAAFWSLATQVQGLIGSKGILPVAHFLKAASAYWGGQAFWHLPTLCWWNAGDGFLTLLCIAGMVVSAVLFLGFFPSLSALALWVLYLSLTVAGQDFLGFQWDNLLLEVGLLCIFLYPPFARHIEQSRPSTVIIWLLRVLVCRLMLESGAVKLLSGDPTWANLTALTYHYLTQPLPHVLGWWVAQLPAWLHKVSCFLMFAVEFVAPVLVFCGRQARFIAFFALAGLQLVIFLTGNYCFFNLLVMALCLTFLDDDQLKALLPFLPVSKAQELKVSVTHRVIAIAVAVVVGVVSACGVYMQMTRQALPTPLNVVTSAAAPFRSINTYGLFAVMTTQRNEIIIEGSDDGQLWLSYEMPWKPGNVAAMPKWAAPHQPRLDWQMWFAALGEYRQNPWFLNCLQRLLEGSPPVLALFKANPFKQKPPKYLRASFYEYHFTDAKTQRKIKTWWRREYKGQYCPVVTLPE